MTPNGFIPLRFGIAVSPKPCHKFPEAPQWMLFCLPRVEIILQLYLLIHWALVSYIQRISTVRDLLLKSLHEYICAVTECGIVLHMFKTVNLRTPYGQEVGSQPLKTCINSRLRQIWNLIAKGRNNVGKRITSRRITRHKKWRPSVQEQLFKRVLWVTRVVLKFSKYAQN